MSPVKLYHRISKEDWDNCKRLRYLYKFYHKRITCVEWGSWTKRLKIKGKRLIHFQPKVPCFEDHSVSSRGKYSTIIVCNLKNILKLTHVWGWETNSYGGHTYLSDFRGEAYKIETLEEFNSWYDKKENLVGGDPHDCETYEIIVPRATLPINLFKELPEKEIKAFELDISE